MISSDKLRDIRRNISEFAREVVAPTYEDSLPASFGQDGEFDEQQFAALKEANASQQAKVVALSTELDEKRQSLTSALAKQKQDQVTITSLQTQLSKSKANEESMILQIQQLQQQHQNQSRECQKVQRQVADLQALIEKQRKEVFKHNEEQTSRQLADFCGYLDTIAAIISTSGSADGAGLPHRMDLPGDRNLHAKIEYIISAITRQNETVALLATPPRKSTVSIYTTHENGSSPSSSLPLSSPGGSSSSPPSDLDGKATGITSTISAPSATAPNGMVTNNNHEMMEYMRTTMKSQLNEIDSLKNQLTQLRVLHQEQEHLQLLKHQESESKLNQQMFLQQQQFQQQLTQQAQMLQQERITFQSDTQRFSSTISQLQQTIDDQKKNYEQQIQMLRSQMHETQRITQQVEGRGNDLETQFNESQVAISRLTIQLREETGRSQAMRASHQNEIDNITKTSDKLRRQLTALQDEYDALKEKHRMYGQDLENAESQVEHLKAELAMAQNEIARLKYELETKEDEFALQETAVTNLQSVLDTFRSEREKEIEHRLAGSRNTINGLHDQIRTLEDTICRHTGEIDKLKEAHLKELQQNRRHIDSLEDKIRQLLEAMEAQMKRMNDENTIDKQLVNHLFMRYFSTKDSANGIEVLKVMSKILMWDTEMQRKAGLIKGSQAGFWTGILWPGTSEDSGVTVDKASESLSDLWVSFLERQAITADGSPNASSPITSPPLNPLSLLSSSSSSTAPPFSLTTPPPRGSLEGHGPPGIEKSSSQILQTPERTSVEKTRKSQDGETPQIDQ